MYEAYLSVSVYSHEADFIQGLLKKNENKLTWSFNFTFRYIDILSVNNSRFGDFVDRIQPIQLEIKDTTDTDRSASYMYLDLHLEIDSEFLLETTLYNRRDELWHRYSLVVNQVMVVTVKHSKWCLQLIQYEPVV
jgi:hypothetical protein